MDTNTSVKKVADLTKSKLYGDRLIVEQEVAEIQQTEGGIFIPNDEESTENVSIGKVLAVSPSIAKCDEEDDKIEIGSKVVYSKYAGSVIVFGGKEYRVLRATDLILALPEDLTDNGK